MKASCSLLKLSRFIAARWVERAPSAHNISHVIGGTEASNARYLLYMVNNLGILGVASGIQPPLYNHPDWTSRDHEAANPIPMLESRSRGRRFRHQASLTEKKIHYNSATSEVTKTASVSDALVNHKQMESFTGRYNAAQLFPRALLWLCEDWK